MLSSLAFALAVPNPVVGFAVIVGFGLLAIVSTYYLAELIGGRRLAVVSGLLVAFSPIIVNYTRSYHFAIPATAIATFALLALAKSERFSRLNWALIFGVSIGLLPLTRTMAIAFVPALIAAGLVQVFAAEESRQRRLLAFSASLAFAALTAALWLVPNGASVFGYLLNFGYGARSAGHGVA